MNATWVIDMHDGSDAMCPNTLHNYVWPVSTNPDVMMGIAKNPYSGRFKDSDNDSMTDTLTGLVWKKDANLCRQVSWDDALVCVAKLGAGWRLPTIQELHSLCNWSNADSTGVPQDRSYCNGKAAIVASLLGKVGFKNLKSQYYWSSTTNWSPVTNDSMPDDTAWVIHMYAGYVGYSSTHNYFEHYVWPVRSGR
jgi:hypothetical protein